MTNNIAAQTTQEIRHRLFNRGWTEVKSQHFQFRRNEVDPDPPTAIEVGYVLGECTVKFIAIDARGAEGAMHRRAHTDIERGVGTDFVDRIIERAVEVEDA